MGFAVFADNVYEEKQGGRSLEIYKPPKQFNTMRELEKRLVRGLLYAVAALSAGLLVYTTLLHIDPPNAVPIVFYFALFSICLYVHERYF